MILESTTRSKVEGQPLACGRLSKSAGVSIVTCGGSRLLWGLGCVADDDEALARSEKPEELAAQHQ